MRPQMHIETRTAPQPFVLSLSKDETDSMCGLVGSASSVMSWFDRLTTDGVGGLTSDGVSGLTSDGVGGFASEAGMTAKVLINYEFSE
jgi:hypothetical protein